MSDRADTKLFTAGDAMNADRETLYREWHNMLDQYKAADERARDAERALERMRIFEQWSNLAFVIACGLAGVIGVFLIIGAAATAAIGTLRLFGVI